VIWGANDTVDSLASGRTTAAALHTRLQTIPRQVTSQCWLNPKRPSAAFSTSSLALPTQSATGATRPARRRTWQGVDVPVLIALHEDVDRTRGNEQNGNERESMDSAAINAFAVRVSGMASVGLNAIALVSER
jgi:hypothetical protein